MTQKMSNFQKQKIIKSGWVIWKKKSEWFRGRGKPGRAEERALHVFPQKDRKKKEFFWCEPTWAAKQRHGGAELSLSGTTTTTTATVQHLTSTSSSKNQRRPEPGMEGRWTSTSTSTRTDTHARLNCIFLFTVYSTGRRGRQGENRVASSHDQPSAEFHIERRSRRPIPCYT